MRRNRESGQTLVLMALSLVAILGIVALSIDGGMAYAQRRHMQTAADAAAIAGAESLLISGENAARKRAVEFANANGANITVDDVIIDYGDTKSLSADTTLTVNTFKDAPTSLASVLGITSIGVAATATAAFTPLGGVGDLLPFAIAEQDFVIGKTYDLYEKDTMFGPGNFGYVDFPQSLGETQHGHNSVNVLINEIEHPEDSGYWMVGDLVYGLTGSMASKKIQNAVEEWIGKEATIIVARQTYGQGDSLQYEISGFARFVVTGVYKKGNDRYISGYFTEWVTGGTGGGTDYGSYTIYLSR